MLMHEEETILAHLRKHTDSAIEDLARSCLPGASTETVTHILSNLDWLGYVALFSGPQGQPVAVQLTEKGRLHALRSLARPVR